MVWILVAILLAVAVYWKTKKPQAQKNGEVSDLPTEAEESTEPLDFSQAYQSRWLFTYNEKAFYHKLKAFADENGLYLFAKVRLLDLIEPRPNQKKYRTYFYKVQSKHVDFVLCNQKLVAKWVVELDDASHRQEKRAERDSFVDEVLKNTGYTVLHMESFEEELLKSAVLGKAEA